MRGLTDEQNVTVETAENILRKDYRSDVVGMVSAYANALGDDITDAESASEWLWQSVDGSQRVIYTYQAMQCLMWSDNDGAYADDFGSEGMVKDGCINWSALAFSAYMMDVVEELELYGLPYGDFADIDESVDDADTEHCAKEAEHDTKYANADDAPDFPDFDGDETRKSILEAMGTKVNAELKENGW